MRLVLLTPSGPVILFDDQGEPCEASVSGNTLRTVEVEVIEPSELQDL